MIIYNKLCCHSNANYFGNYLFSNSNFSKFLHIKVRNSMCSLSWLSWFHIKCQKVKCIVWFMAFLWFLVCKVISICSTKSSIPDFLWDKNCLCKDPCYEICFSIPGAEYISTLEYMFWFPIWILAYTSEILDIIQLL